MSFFHGVTTSLIDTGARTISLPSSSIIGLCDTFTASPAVSAKPNDLILLTSEREAIAAFGEDAAITRAAKAVFIRAKAVIVACGVARLEDPALQTSAIIGGVLASGQRTGLQVLLDGKSRFNAQPRLLIAPKHSATQAVATAMDALAGKLRAIAIVDGPNTTDEAALAYAKEFGSKRVFMVDPGVQQWDTITSATIDSPASAFAAGLFAWTPYWQAAGYGVDFPFENYERMADFMRRCKGKVMVSINDHPDIRRVFDGFHFETTEIRYTTTNQRQGKAEVTGELIIMNWEPDAFDGLF